MRRALLLTLVALSATAGPAAAADGAAPYVVALKPGTGPRAAASLARDAGVPVKALYSAANAGFATRLTAAQADALAGRPEVAFLQRDTAVTATGTEKKPGEPQSELQPPGIQRIGAIVDGVPGAPSGVGVAVVDTGIDVATPELDVRDGINCVTPGLPAADDNGHGTHVAGIVGARANGVATVGAAPATALYAVKVLDAQSNGSLSQVLCGLDWVRAHARALDIRVVNMSIGAHGSDDGACGSADGDALHRAVCALTAAGVLVVAAAGNEAGPLERSVPGAYHEVLAVTAMADTDGLPGGKGKAPSCTQKESDDRYASFSNYATTAAGRAHTVAAPGVCVDSTGTGSELVATYYGTSQAAPHAAAAAALCMSEDGIDGPCAALSPAAVIARLQADGLSGKRGFAGDPARPVKGRYYGPLVSVARY
jgi:subtilisin